jgi:hypothetical protein
MEMSFVLTHGRTDVGGVKMASYSGAKGHLSALERAFENAGRSGPWSDERMSGNPCSSKVVSDWRIGYQRDLDAAGVESGERP